MSSILEPSSKPTLQATGTVPIATTLVLFGVVCGLIAFVIMN